MNHLAGSYRATGRSEDHVTQYQMYCCAKYIWVDEHLMKQFICCPLCGTPLTGGLVRTRPSYVSRWAWDREIEQPRRICDDPKPYWEIQSRCVPNPEYILNERSPRSDLFTWKADWNAAWVVRRDNPIRELRHHIKEEADIALFFPVQYRLVYRLKDKILKTYQKPWMLVYPEWDSDMDVIDDHSSHTNH